jgi:predicted integral membrane protein DUF2269
MQWLLPWFLFLHVLAAIVAFGPVLSFPLIGAMGGREPQHANFATRLALTLTDRVAIPVGLSMPVTGAAIIVVAGINLSAPAYRWLGAAILIYAVILAYAIFVQRGAVRRVVELTATPPPPGAAGPPPQLAAAVRRVRLGGMGLSLGIVVILFLMVVKPSFGG